MGKIRIKRKTPTAAYVGSLIQQNHGESLTGHGVLVWDVEETILDQLVHN